MYVSEVVMTFNAVPMELFILKINNHYHNITPNGIFYKLCKSVIIVELLINYVFQSSVRKNYNQYKSQDDFSNF